MAKKIVFYFLIICFLNAASVAFAQSPPSAPPVNITVDVDDVNSFTPDSNGDYPIVDLINNVPGVVLVSPAESADDLKLDLQEEIITASDSVVVQMPFEIYIKGVVVSELGAPLEAAKAQAVASRSFAAGYVVPYLPSGYIDDIFTGNEVDYDTIGDISQQAYTAYVPSNVKKWDNPGSSEDGFAGQATTFTINQAIYSYNPKKKEVDIAFCPFAASFGGHSSDEIENPMRDYDWNFPAYLKSRDDGTVTAYGGVLGLSQNGAQTNVSSGWNYLGILNYYYAVNPPIVRAVDIYPSNNQTPVYSRELDDVGPNLTTVSGMDISERPDYRTADIYPNNNLGAGSTADILVTTNESINTNIPLTVTFISSGMTQPTTINGSWNTTSQGTFPSWEGLFTVPATPGTYYLAINGQGVSIQIQPTPTVVSNPSVASSYSLASNPMTPTSMNLTPGPSLILNYTPGPDTSYSFVVGPTITPTNTPVLPTPTPTTYISAQVLTQTWAPTSTFTRTNTPSFTYTRTITLTPTITNTPTNTGSPTPSNTIIICPLNTPSISWNANAGSYSGAGFAFAPSGQVPQMWGISESIETANSIYSSFDGINWQPKSNPGLLTERNAEGALAFNGNIWIIGGNHGGGQDYLSDTWYSPDGGSWTPGPSLNVPTEEFGTAAFNGNMYVVCGLVSGGTGVNNMVNWGNGASWNSYTASFNGQRFEPSVFVFNGKLWVIGGIGSSTNNVFDDIYWSGDGQTWNPITPVGPYFSGRGSASVVVAGNGLWLFGGLGPSLSALNDVWYTQDCIHWTPMGNLPSGSGNYAGSYFYANKIWTNGCNSNPCFIATQTATPTVTATPTITIVPCGSSLPGYTWNSLATTASSYGFDYALSFDPQQGQEPDMWLIGTNTGGPNEYVSSNGVSWNSPTISSISPYNAERNSGTYGCVVYNGKIWIAGGIHSQSGGYTFFQDVWSSPNGSNWSEAVTTAAFGPRDDFGMISFNGKMWVIGGTTYTSPSNPLYLANDVWNSTDGVNWSPVKIAGPIFSPRSAFGCVVFNGQIWVIGGQDTTVGPRNDVWSSSDGSHWTFQGNAPFSGRSNLQVVVSGNSLCVIGGRAGQNPQYPADFWFTLDGKNWKESNNSTPYSSSGYVSQPFLSYGNMVWGFTQGTTNGPWVWNSTGCNMLTSTPTNTPTPNPLVFSCPETKTFTASDPYGLALDANGNIYAADNTYNQVDIFNSLGVSIGAWSGTGSYAFGEPNGVAVHGNNIYVVDYDNNLVDEFTLNGTPVTQWNGYGSGNGQFSEPWGIAVNNAGTTVYVADWGNDKVGAFGPSGNYLTQWGSEGSTLLGTFGAPSGVALDNNGFVYVTDYDTNRVEVFNSQGVTQYQWSTAPILQGADFISIDNVTNLVYVSDGVGTVAVYNEQGSLQGTVYGTGTGFSYPEGVAVKDGTWYVAEQGANQIDQFGSCNAGGTPVGSPTVNPSNTFTLTPTFTFTITPTFTKTNSATNTFTNTISNTPTKTLTPTNTITPTLSITPTTNPTYGVSWAQSAGTVPFAKRWGQTSVVFNNGMGNRIILLAGQNGSGNFNDVWSSPDGVNWSNPVTNGSGGTPFSGSGLCSTVYNGKIYVIGSNVYSSSDGLIWTNLGPSPSNFSSGIIVQNVTVFNDGTGDKLWMAGAVSQTQPPHSVNAAVWSSIDGITWNQAATITAGSLPRSSYGWLSYAGKLWMIGGQNQGSCFSDVWSSSNGVSWAPVTPNAFPARYQFGSFVANGRIWVIGGNNCATGSQSPDLNDVWYSTNGSTWTKTINAALTTARDSESGLAFAEKAWVFGGRYSSRANGIPTPLNEVWYSPPTPIPTATISPTPTFTPNGGRAKPGIVGSTEGRTLTPTPTISPTITPSPTPSPLTGLFSVVAVPNISKNGEPIEFKFLLNHAAQISLQLFTLSGEKAFRLSSSGQMGKNEIVWDLRNNFREMVASGLYIYFVQVNDGTIQERKTGKVAVIK